MPDTHNRIDNTVDSESIGVDRDLDRAARELYDAEVALHAARQTGIDSWVAAAANQLHRAIVRHNSAERWYQHLSKQPATLVLPY
jgi:hypothetical protein